jgi:hypothetical protein
MKKTSGTRNANLAAPLSSYALRALATASGVKAKGSAPVGANVPKKVSSSAGPYKSKMTLKRFT